MTFTLPGFNTVKREGIELTGNFVASVSVEMRVGAVAETITVSGEAPIVDVTSSRRQQTIRATMRSPRFRSSRQALWPDHVGTSAQHPGERHRRCIGADFSVFQIHGGRRNEGQVLVDGLSMGFQGMGVSFYVPEVGTAQEVTFICRAASARRPLVVRR